MDIEIQHAQTIMVASRTVTPDQRTLWEALVNHPTHKKTPWGIELMRGVTPPPTPIIFDN